MKKKVVNLVDVVKIIELLSVSLSGFFGALGGVNIMKHRLSQIEKRVESLNCQATIPVLIEKQKRTDERLKELESEVFKH